MATLWLVLYNVFVIPVLWIALRSIALWNDKVRRGLNGRRRLFASLHAKLSLRGSRRTFWIHVASMGEFEQAKPILERLKSHDPALFILVTFFSPSGFDHSKDYSLADAVAYIPFDSRRAASRFVSIVRPDAALFIRYELWLNHLSALHRARVPSFLACTSSQNYVRQNFIVRSYLRTAYRTFDMIFCNDDADRTVFAEVLGDPTRCIVTGDTRFDRVVERAGASRSHPPLPDAIVRDKFILVCGSTWLDDEHALFPAIDDAIKTYGDRFLCIIAPHEPTPEECARIVARFRCCRYSRIDGYAGEAVVLIDSVGPLFGMYQYANAAYVGGGWSAGIHNVLEPAAFGAAVITGPRIDRSPEAQELSDAGGLQVAKTLEDVRMLIEAAIADPVATATRGARAKTFADRRTGASERIIGELIRRKIVGR